MYRFLQQSAEQGGKVRIGKTWLMWALSVHLFIVVWERHRYNIGWCVLLGYTWSVCSILLVGKPVSVPLSQVVYVLWMLVSIVAGVAFLDMKCTCRKHRQLFERVWSVFEVDFIAGIFCAWAVSDTHWMQCTWCLLLSAVILQLDYPFRNEKVIQQLDGEWWDHMWRSLIKLLSVLSCTG